jgi:excisionase family DNA binding protein
MQELLTVCEVARVLGRKPWSVYMAIQRGEIPALKIGRSVRIQPKELEEYLERCRFKPIAERRKNVAL